MDWGMKEISWPQQPVTRPIIIEVTRLYFSMLNLIKKMHHQELELDTITCGTFFYLNILAMSTQ